MNFLVVPDSPSSISVFYYPETKLTNSVELERGRNLALADKVNALDIEKLAKQKISLPATLMDLVWTIQNFHAVISLCFGVQSHSAWFLQGRVNHVYDNRILYSSSQSSDPYFFEKVLFTIDSALQWHWCTCSSAPNRSSVNDAILRMDDGQEAILGLSFSQNLPRLISDKVLTQINSTKDGNQDGKEGEKWETLSRTR